MAFALGQLRLAYETLNEKEIKEGRLFDFGFLIVPGGYTQEYSPALGEEGREAIRRFVRQGGGYLGICAGAYLAAEKVEVPGKPRGLGLIAVQNLRQSGQGMRTIYLAQHPATRGLPQQITIYYQNGPEILPQEGVAKIASYRNGRLAVAIGSFGEGKVVIFSPHPEGSITQGIKPSPGTEPLKSPEVVELLLTHHLRELGTLATLAHKQPESGGT